MVLGEAVFTTGGTNYLEDLLAVSGEWIDWYKFVWSSFPLQPPALVDRKIALLEDSDVRSFVGGNFFEEAVERDCVHEFLEALATTRCPGLEVSTTVVDVSLERKAELIETATDYGFHVHGEVGRKPSETGAEGLSLDALLADARTCLDAGADVVVLETEEVAGMLDSGESGDGAGEGAVDRRLRVVLEEIGAANVLFEVPISADMHEVLSVTGWFVESVGPDVNLGNVNPYLVSMVEQQRRGIGAHQH